MSQWLSEATPPDVSRPSNGSPHPIHRCAPTAMTGRRRKRLAFQRWTLPGTARDGAIARSEIRPSFLQVNSCESSEFLAVPNRSSNCTDFGEDSGNSATLLPHRR
jgi:hypothetical protein